jgi:ABC-2 type transport system ATP-binding protein
MLNNRDMANNVIEVSDLVKVYPDGTRAVDGVTFNVSAGEIYGFLGPNGAGKTTIIRILVTLLPKTSGEARVGGVDVASDPEAVRRMFGYTAQSIAVDDDLTARENLVLQGRLHGLSTATGKARADELLDLFSLTEVANKRAGAFSGGMRRRLDLAQALAHKPPLLFLDEPTTGLDPQSRNALWKHLQELNDQGTTVFLTTQYMEEADRLASRVAIIDHGRIVITGTPDTLKQEVGGDVITLTLPESADDDVRRRALGTLRSFPGTGELTVYDHSVAVPVNHAGQSLSALVRRLDEERIPIEQLALRSPSLDEVFLKATGERLRVEDSASSRSSATFAATHGRRRR